MDILSLKEQYQRSVYDTTGGIKAWYFAPTKFCDFKLYIGRFSRNHWEVLHTILIRNEFVTEHSVNVLEELLRNKINLADLPKTINSAKTIRALEKLLEQNNQRD